MLQYRCGAAAKRRISSGKATTAAEFVEADRVRFDDDISIGSCSLTPGSWKPVFGAKERQRSELSGGTNFVGRRHRHEEQSAFQCGLYEDGT